MRAVVHDKYGPPTVLRLDEIDRPVPKDDELLIKIHATSVNRSDCGWRSGEPFFSRFFTGVRRPRRRVLGSEFAGEVAAVGSAVSKFAVGDQVFGACGFGAHAEYLCMRESRLVAHKPQGMSFQEAGARGACIAGACLKAVNLADGRSILIYGASGAIGTAAVQLARQTGAQITAVCNTKNLELVKSLGADSVIDYTAEDFTKNGEQYDVVFDAVGKNSFRHCRRSIKRGGTYIETDLGFMWHVPPLALLTRLSHRLGGRRVTMPIEVRGRDHRSKQ
jgi:NADPH:quinone reductase-like Zn-dependent oxidoreductase